MQCRSDIVRMVYKGRLPEIRNIQPHDKPSWHSGYHDLLGFFLDAGLLCLLLIAMMAVFTVRSWAETPPAVESTLLMFVGEDIEVLSIASRREESAWQAPAIVEVISREELKQRGSDTVSRALSMMPGFYMAQKEMGTLPYLRGIPNSVLFLYDTVPLNADTSKSLHQLDQQVSLGPVKRIEIIRGPGSVLWGPDAFAGIVNIVPLTGKDIDGIETSVSYATPWDQAGFTMNAGRDMGDWDAFISVNGRKGDAEDDRSVNLVRFWRNEEDIFFPAERMGEQALSEARYLDVFSRIAWKDRFNITARIADNHKPYAISRSEEDLTWQETREIPGGFLKLEAKNDISRSAALRFTGYYSQYRPSTTVIDRTFEQKEQSGYGELIFDKSFDSGRTLLTSGVSYREKWVDNANIWVSYLPDFLGPDNGAFTPKFIREDYDTRLWSFFSQYNRKIGPVDLSGGIRFDKHDVYKDNLSYSIAGVYPHPSKWVFKFMLGTAYRTPYARQLIKDDSPDLEEIQSASLQAAWVPSTRMDVALTGFFNRIENHIQEDPYAGLSLPNHQDISGLEIQGKLRATERIDMAANLTLMDNAGPSETYHYLKSIFVRPDGSIEEIFDNLNYDYDTGPVALFNLMGTWRAGSDATLFTRLSYASSQNQINPRGTGGRTYSGRWLADATLQVKNVFSGGWDVGISLRNLFDSRNKVPGVYSGINCTPVEVEMVIRKHW
jgi:outer membrane receptor for ferrienterochelin and colicin